MNNKCKNNSCIFQLKKLYKQCYFCNSIIIESTKEQYKHIKEILQEKYIIK